MPRILPVLGLALALRCGAFAQTPTPAPALTLTLQEAMERAKAVSQQLLSADIDRKSTRLNSSHLVISYAVFCLKKKIDHRFNTHGVLSRELLPSLILSRTVKVVAGRHAYQHESRRSATPRLHRFFFF